MLSNSDSDSDYSPHFKTFETIALVEPERSLTDKKCYARTNKSNTNLNKNNRILRDLDKIEVLSNHNNESNSMIKDHRSFSYEAFKNQLNVTQENSAQKLNPLTSTRCHNEPPNKQRIEPRIKLPSATPRIQYNIKKFEYKESSSEDDPNDKLFEIIKKRTKPLPKMKLKPVKREPLAHPYPYIKKFNGKEDSSEDDILEAVQEELKTVKRGRSTISKKKSFKKSKPRASSRVNLPQSCHKNVLPKLKPQQTLLTKKLVGNQDHDFLSISSLELDNVCEPKNGSKTLINSVPVLEDDIMIANKPKESPVGILEYFKSSKQDDFSCLPTLKDSVSKSNDGSKTLTGEIDAPLEPVLEDDKIIVTKPNESSVGILKCVQNFKQDEFSSLSSLCNSLELNSDLEPIEEVGVKILSVCHLKPNEEMHPLVRDLFVSNENTEVIRNQTMALSQSNFLNRFDQFEMSECADSGLLTKNKFKKSNMEIYEWIATGGETQEDVIVNQTEERLKEMSKIIQNSMNAIHGPITFKNCKFYNFLVELESKLNAYFSANSGIEEKDFDNFM